MPIARRLRSPISVRLVAAFAAAALLLAVGAPRASAQAKPSYDVFGSCATAKPFKPAGTCAFDRPEHAQGTIVFRSHVGKRSLKVCQRILGLSFHGKQCLKGNKPTAYETIPFHLNGAYDDFKVVVDVYTRSPGSHAAFVKAARVQLRFHA